VATVATAATGNRADGAATRVGSRGNRRPEHDLRCILKSLGLAFGLTCECSVAPRRWARQQLHSGHAKERGEAWGRHSKARAAVRGCCMTMADRHRELPRAREKHALPGVVEAV